MNTTNGHNEMDLSAERQRAVPAQREPEPFARGQRSVPERPAPTGSGSIDAKRGESALGGTLRKAARRLPNDDSKREALMLFADRMDTAEDQLVELARNPLTWVALAAGAGGLAYALHASRPKPWFERLVPQARSWMRRAFS